ncbi:MAG: hypothetical protein C4K60_18870 [Ideonella sp. MAG2]|nr:MAG: hypothetical protein C4K60_18870 [Ideonella sp. MAG2]
MSWNAATLWWAAAGLLVLAELATGTFYLLMLALGLVGAAVAAHAGLGLSAQLLLAALVGGGAVMAWRQRRQRSAAPLAPSANPDLQLDVGGRVVVDQWTADARSTVNYRGSAWGARAADGVALSTGPHVIVAVEGNVLVLAPASAHS